MVVGKFWVGILENPASPRRALINTVISIEIAGRRVCILADARMPLPVNGTDFIERSRPFFLYLELELGQLN